MHWFMPSLTLLTKGGVKASCTSLFNHFRAIDIDYMILHSCEL